MPLPWETVWIIGASTGIGKAVAEQLAAQGAKVAASARSLEKLQTLSQGIKPYPLDVTKPQDVARTIKQIEMELGPIDLAILGAGMYQPMAASEFSAEVMRNTLDTNVMGVANALAELLPLMRQRQQGHVAVIASVAGYSGLPKAAAYGASKAALINMAESLAPELARDNITLSVINPGFVETPMTAVNDFPMPFVMQPDEAATLIIKGLTKKRFEIAFPWIFVSILKLLKLLPYPIYFWLTRRLVK